ncbi:hypothetical protein OBBRIDRAFT_886566 [Obba rivulosa]|uniref:rRNA-processing protein EFG1 n=1 Tax=Obba rivulosa TaxID=1052685 RepID=A0A8E2AW01_9APHY|nr:hypothetical protein OBBRIDRAFT_886566 [Obba rivulosa]
MAPTRTGEQAGSTAGPSTSKRPHKNASERKTVRHKSQIHPYSRPGQGTREEPALPGVQKLKAALRQTRRLLAKDKLAADVRVETERRAKALEADIARAEQARKERAMAVRYHAIKFFERQKVTRKLQQTKRQLAATSDADERKALEEKVFALRVDLNYITHYPKAKKYISLFPPEARHPEQRTQKDKQKQAEKDATRSETDAQRDALRAWIRECMSRGEMSAEPEHERPEARGRTLGGSEPASVGKAKGGNGKTDAGAPKAKRKGGDGVVDDAFFESGSADESGSGSEDGESGGDEDVDMEE